MVLGYGQLGPSIKSVHKNPSYTHAEKFVHNLC